MINIYKTNKIYMVGFLLLLTCISYSPVNHNNFINFDDDIYVTENFHIKDGLTLKNIQWAFTSIYAKNWHPLTWISHMLDIELFNMNPAGHHLINLFFHLLNSLLLFVLLHQMTGCYWKSLFVMTLFALHPMHVESVAWVSERKDVLSTFFWALSIWAYTGYVKKPEIKNYLIVCILFILSLLAKPMGVTLPFVLLLLDHWPLKRWKVIAAEQQNHSIKQQAFSTLIIEKIPFFLIASASCAITFYAQSKGGALGSFELYPIEIRIANAITSYFQYILKIFYPIHFTILYPHPGMPQLQLLILSSFFLIFMTGLSILNFKRLPWLSTGWFWYIGILFPVIGLVQVGAQGMADRYTYTSMIGIYIVLIWSIEHLFGAIKLSQKTISFLYTLFLLTTIMALSFLTFHQVQYWKDSKTLFQHVVNITQNNYIAHNNLANAMTNSSQFDKAIFHYTKALRIKPDYNIALGNMGIAYTKLGKHDKAWEAYSKALKLSPENEHLLTNIGNLFFNLKDNEKAEYYYNKALFYNPDYVEAHINLGNLLMSTGNLDKAMSQYFKALSIDLNHKEVAHNQMGNLLSKEGNIDLAIHHYRLAIEISPTYAKAHNNIGVALAKKGKFYEAVSHFKKALQINPEEPGAAKNLKRAMGLLNKNNNHGN